MADLTTIADYKDAEGINNPKHDLRLEALVPSVSQLVKTYCGNSIIDFFSTNKEEVLNINFNNFQHRNSGYGFITPIFTNLSPCAFRIR